MAKEHRLPKEERKEIQYKYLVNELEKEMLDNLGKPYQWRTFNVLVARVYEQVGREPLVLDDGREITLEQVDLARFIRDVFERKKFVRAEDIIED